MLKSSLHRARILILLGLQEGGPSSPHQQTGWPHQPCCLSPGDQTPSRATNSHQCQVLPVLFFQLSSKITVEPKYQALSAPHHHETAAFSCKKPRLVELVFWLLFKAIVPTKPGLGGMRSFGVDEWASPTIGLAITPGEGKGFGYLQFPPNRYVNYFPPPPPGAFLEHSPLTIDAH